MSRSRFRDQRVFHVDDPGGEAGGWYFEVREGPPHGPYQSRRLAEEALADYVNGREASSRREHGGNEGDETDDGR